MGIIMDGGIVGGLVDFDFPKQPVYKEEIFKVIEAALLKAYRDDSTRAFGFGDWEKEAKQLLTDARKLYRVLDEVEVDDELIVLMEMMLWKASQHTNEFDVTEEQIKDSVSIAAKEVAEKIHDLCTLDSVPASPPTHRGTSGHNRGIGGR